MTDNRFQTRNKPPRNERINTNKLCNQKYDKKIGVAKDRFAEPKYIKNIIKFSKHIQYKSG